MKRFITFLASFAIVICSLSSCRIEGYDTGYDDGYDDGYDIGFDYGYAKGIAEAQQFLAFIVDDDLRCLGRDLEDQYGIHPEEAVQILSNYADVPDEVSEEELHNAIWAIYRYYYRSHEVINGIEYYDIE